MGGFYFHNLLFEGVPCVVNWLEVILFTDAAYSLSGFMDEW